MPPQPDNFQHPFHSFLGNAFKRVPFWRPKLTAGKPLPIEPEVYTQDVKIGFDRWGVVRPVKNKAGAMTVGDILDGNDSMTLWRPAGGSPVDALRAMENNKGYVYAANNAIAREIMNIDWRLFQVSGKDHKEQTEHEILDLLDGVNDFMIGSELKYLTSSHLTLAGNAYWYLEGVKNDTDQPTAIYPLNPSVVRLMLDKTTFPYKVAGYAMKLENKQFKFQPYEILHFRLPNPSNLYEGMSPVQAGAEYIDNDNYAMEFNRKFFINGARPSGFLESEAVAETQIEAIKVGFADMHEGIDNMQRIAVLPKGVKWNSAGANPKDMDFKNLSENMRDRILAMFGVSKTILGTAESDTNRATSETADYVFSKRVIKPHMQLICGFINEKLVPRYGDDLYISFIDPVPEDRNARMQEMAAASGGVPLMTQDEAREEYLGLGPIEGGDTLLVPTSMAPAGTPEGDGDPTPEAEGNPDVGKNFERKTQTAANGAKVAYRPARTKLQTIAKHRKQISDSLADKIKAALERAASHPTKKFESNKEQDEVAWKEFSDRTHEAEKKIGDLVREFNAKQKQEVLDNLSSAVEKAIDPTKLFDIDHWISIMTDAFTPIMEGLFEGEAKAALAAIGKPDMTPFTDTSRAALHDSISLMSQTYNETTLQTLEVKLNEGLAQGHGIADLTKTVSDIYEWSDTYRAERVSKTEAFRTSNAALKTAWQQSGVVKTVRWYVSEKDNVCPFCLAMNGTTSDISDNFFDNGQNLTVGEGDQAQTMSLDYGDVGGPPLHPNCACFIRPDEVSLD